MRITTISLDQKEKNLIVLCLGMAGPEVRVGVPDMTSISDMDENGINRNLQVGMKGDTIEMREGY